MTSIINDCKVTFTALADDESPAVLKNIEATVNHPQHGDIASLQAIQINRHRCRGMFLEAMDENSDELLQFGTKLFDKKGQMRPWLVESEYHKGTGCWGFELNEGMLVYIMSIEVKPTLRNQGVGSWLFKELVGSSHVGTADWIICWPSPTDRIYDQGQRAMQHARVTRFFRKNGFRRVARTDFVAYSPNPDHPSRRLPMSDDIEPAHNDFPPPTALDRTTQSLRFPLHHAIATIDDESIENILRMAHSTDPTSIHRRDDSGFHPLFLATSFGRLYAVRTLLALGVRDDLIRRDNSDGLTPLEVCAKEMQSIREFQETLLGRWDGYAEDQLKIKVMLKRAMGHTIGMSDDEYVAAKKWGCTCGSCIAGWFSPRMIWRFQVQSNLQYDNMSVMMDSMQFVPRQPLPKEEFDLALDFIPPEMWLHVYKTFYLGYHAVFKAISRVVHRQSSPIRLPIPTTSVVLTELVDTVRNGTSHYFDAQAVDFFLNKGGKVDWALDCVVHAMEEQEEDGSFSEMWDDPEYGSDEWRTLPHCANDLEFRLVREMIGLSKGKVWGPYYQSTGDDGMDDEDDYGDMDDDMGRVLAGLSQLE